MSIVTQTETQGTSKASIKKQKNGLKCLKLPQSILTRKPQLSLSHVCHFLVSPLNSCFETQVHCICATCRVPVFFCVFCFCSEFQYRVVFSQFAVFLSMPSNWWECFHSLLLSCLYVYMCLFNQQYSELFGPPIILQTDWTSWIVFHRLTAILNNTPTQTAPCTVLTSSAKAQ